MSTFETLLTWLCDRRFDTQERRIYKIHVQGDRKPNYQVVRHHLMLNDGVTISLQYSNSHYCTGTDTLPETFEMWHCPPSPILGEHDENDPYAYVPLQTTIAYLDSHGGIMDLKTQLAMRIVEEA